MPKGVLRADSGLRGSNHSACSECPTQAERGRRVLGDCMRGERMVQSCICVRNRKMAGVAGRWGVRVTKKSQRPHRDAAK